MLRYLGRNTIEFCTVVFKHEYRLIAIFHGTHIYLDFFKHKLKVG